MGRLRIKQRVRHTCRKCRSELVNKPEYGAVCPKCGWYRRSWTYRDESEDSQMEEGDPDAKKL